MKNKMNIKTQIELSVQGLEASWSIVQTQEEAPSISVDDSGKTVLQGLQDGLPGYDLLPFRMRVLYAKLIKPGVIDSATFSITQSSTTELCYSVLD